MLGALAVARGLPVYLVDIDHDVQCAQEVGPVNTRIFLFRTHVALWALSERKAPVVAQIIIKEPPPQLDVLGARADIGQVFVDGDEDIGDVGCTYSDDAKLKAPFWTWR